MMSLRAPCIAASEFRCGAMISVLFFQDAHTEMMHNSVVTPFGVVRWELR
jgi:hypothetical protein